MSMFAEKIAKATARSRLPFFPIGDFVVEVDVVKEISGRKGEFFIAELKVIETSTEETKEGARHAWVVKMDDPDSVDLAAGNVKSMLAAAMGSKDPEELTEGDIDAALSTDNPLNGRLLLLQTHTTITEKRKKEFTVHAWLPVSDEDQEKS